MLMVNYSRYLLQGVWQFCIIIFLCYGLHNTSGTYRRGCGRMAWPKNREARIAAKYGGRGKPKNLLIIGC